MRIFKSWNEYLSSEQQHYLNREDSNDLNICTAVKTYDGYKIENSNNHWIVLIYGNKEYRTFLIFSIWKNLYEIISDCDIDEVIEYCRQLGDKINEGDK